MKEAEEISIYPSHKEGGGRGFFLKNLLNGNQEKHVKLALYKFILGIQKNK